MFFVTLFLCILFFGLDPISPQSSKLLISFLLHTVNPQVYIAMISLNVSIGRGTFKMEHAHSGRTAFMTMDRPRVLLVETDTAQIIV